MKNIFVLPQWEAESFTLERPFAIISITDPGEQAKLRNDIPKLRLEFKDYKRPFETMPTENRFLMTPQQGKAVWEFINKLPPFFDDLVISCEVGASRSPSMAMAICDGLGISRRAIIGPNEKLREIIPNEHVYVTTLRATLRMVA